MTSPASWAKLSTPLAKSFTTAANPPIVQDIMAKRIIAAARTGERDVTRLRDIALAALGHTPK
jgi:hypothetical protein